MMKSKKPKKQRKFLFKAPLHIKHKLLSAHLSKNLINQWKRRSLPLRTGDEVKIMRGGFRGTIGKITNVDLKRLKVYIDNVKRRKVSGEEVHIPIRPSKLLLLNPVTDDKKRLDAINKLKMVKRVDKIKKTRST